jgi:TPR repeat protein
MARALSVWSGAQGSRELACVARLLSDACTLAFEGEAARLAPLRSQEHAAACSYAGRMWLDGRGVARDPERGLGMLARACVAGVAVACKVGARWLAEEGHADSVKDGPGLRARLEAESSCLAGSAEDCTVLGMAYAAGREPYPRDMARSAIEYQRACNLGSGPACSNLGDAFEYGEAVPRDLVRAASLYERACHIGTPVGCANLGHLAEHGEGIVRDVTRARALYHDACVQGDTYGCLHAQLMAAEDAGAPREPQRSLAYWRRACEARDGRACAFVGLMFEDGPDGYARDEAKSLQAMSRACELGLRVGCEWVQLRTGP